MRKRIGTLMILCNIGLAGFMHAQSDPDRLRIPLDSTGVADWSYLNPANVPALDRRAVEFENTTSDRTFVVTMPFAFTTAEFNRAFAAARLQRDRQTLADVVCDALIEPSRRARCEAARDELDRIEELRVFLESLTAVGDDPPDVVVCDPSAPACVVERTYWAAACKFCGTAPPPTLDDRIKAFRGYLRTEADAEVLRLITNGDPASVRELLCDIAEAAVVNKRVIRTVDGVPDCTPVAPAQGAAGVLDKAIDAIGDAEAIKQFKADRTRVAKVELTDATRQELLDTISMGTVEHVRQDLQDDFDAEEANARTARTATQRDVHSMNASRIEAAAKLLRSYSPDSPVPYGWHVAIQTSANVNTADLGVAVEDCQPPAAGAVKCTATATIPPRQLARFSNATVRHSPEDLIRFNVSFFGQTTPPPNSVAFVRLRPAPRGKLLSVPAQFAIGLGVDGGTAYDLSKDLTGHHRHTFGTGTAAIGFTGGAVDSSVSLRFKAGDFGGPATTQTVDVSEYQAKVFGPRGIALQFGEFTFARPSSAIAVSERGEGILVALKKFTASYIIQRESDGEDGSINTQDDDYYVALGQMKNITIGGGRFLDGFDLMLAYGNNKGDDRPAPDKPRRAAYTYTTFGTEARFSFLELARFSRIRNAALSVAAYHSQRQVRPRREESVELQDGRGSVGLLTFGWRWSGNAALFAEERKARPPYGPTFSIGRGTGDDPESAPDDGYLGENAGFAADKIFLSQISKHSSYEATIGRGLENKWYAGVQWTDARGSLLSWLAGMIGKQESIVSRNTIVSLHTYRFARPVHGRHAAGIEADLEFQVESPAKVTWSLAGAYYHRSRAVELAGITSNLWQVTASVALKLQNP